MKAFIAVVVFLALGSWADLDESAESDSSDHGFDELVRETIQNWTRAFFDMSKRPRDGKVTLIFPGLFGSDDLSHNLIDKYEVVPSQGEWLTSLAQLINSMVSPLNQADIVRKDRKDLNKESAEMSPQTLSKRMALDTDHIIISNDSNWYEKSIEFYPFEGIELLEDEQRQRRRLRSASDGFHLINANVEHISTMINSVFSSSRDYISNETVRSSVVRYLTTKMRSFGLVVGNQLFDPREFMELFHDHPIPVGTNIVGILPGELWNTKDDEILIIGAHWDTVPSSYGMDDNGSGVTALLEVARALTESACRPKHTIIFVAFDLEEVGCLGSMYFVRDFLIPRVLNVHEGARVKGAYILDTIMNYNETQFSQILSPEWQKALPVFSENLKEENFTGNFLTVLYRKEFDSLLARMLAKHWDVQPMNKSNFKSSRHRRNEIQKSDDKEDIVTVRSKSNFHLKKVRLDLDAQVNDTASLASWIDLLRSDHSRFWFHNLDYPQSIPAVLVTDTGPYRGVMRECYHQSCDSSTDNQLSKFANVTFLTKTCQALIYSVIDLSESQCMAQRDNFYMMDTYRNHIPPLSWSALTISLSPLLIIFRSVWTA